MTSDDDQQLPLLSDMMSSFCWWCSFSCWWYPFSFASAVDDIASAYTVDGDVDAVDADVVDDDTIADIYIIDADDDSRRIPLLVKGEC